MYKCKPQSQLLCLFGSSLCPRRFSQTVPHKNWTIKALWSKYTLHSCFLCILGFFFFFWVVLRFCGNFMLKNVQHASMLCPLRWDGEKWTRFQVCFFSLMYIPALLAQCCNGLGMVLMQGQGDVSAIEEKERDDQGKKKGKKEKDWKWSQDYELQDLVALTPVLPEWVETGTRRACVPWIVNTNLLGEKRSWGSGEMG